MRYVVLYEIDEDRMGQEIVMARTPAIAAKKAREWTQRDKGFRVLCMTDEKGQRFDPSGNRVDD